MSRKITVSGVGCCLVDRLYNNISFTEPGFSKYLSKNKGDGGLTPGQLVFTEEFEKFSGTGFTTSLAEITQGKSHDKINIGGPGIVAMIHAAQLLDETECDCRFYGCGGKDEDGEFLLSALKKTPVTFSSYKLSGTITPSTVVLSDPTFDNGHGERIFINSIGAAWNYSPDDLDDEFFSSDVVVFGGTALVPTIHDNLTELLEKAKSKGCITVVNTVYDFRNEKTNPQKNGRSEKTMTATETSIFLITDFEEALRLSGKSNADAAMQFFKEKKTGAVIITNGAKNIRFSVQNSNLFQKAKDAEMPVSKAVSDELKQGHFGDTTGCGDNFVGGVIASLVSQLQKSRSGFDLTEACMWGIVSGGYSCFYMGGTYFENEFGEKRKLIMPYYEKYKNQLSGKNKSILIFGAGKIGRSFIGQLFGIAGYDVIFADVDLEIVSELNQRKSYPVIIKGEMEKTILVPNVRAVYAGDQKKVIEEISQASVLAVSVGKNALGKVIPVIADGLILRYQLNPNLPLDIIIAENIRSADEFIYEQLSSKLPDNYPINKLVGLVETSIGKMVPIMTSADLMQDPLQVFAEPYNDLILDKKGFKGEIPKVKGLSPKENIKAWVDRKAFIHNLGHATVAYVGAFYHPEFQFIYEVLKDKQIFTFTRKVMIHSANILLQYYPSDFTLNDLELHIDDLLHRFQNKALKDTVFRVGQDLPRKLNIDDRFAAVIQMAKQKELEYDLILEAMTFGFFFRKTNENGQLSEPDKLFQNALKSGIENALINWCGFNPEKDKSLMDELKIKFLELQQLKWLQPTKID